MAYSKTSLANRALSLIGNDPSLLDLTTDTTETGRIVNLHYEPVFLRCLRRAEWPFAIKRLALSPDATAPTNEYTYRFALPTNSMKILEVFPSSLDYRIEEGYLLCYQDAVTIRYIDKSVIDNSSVVDPAFAEWFSYELAMSIAPQLTDSTTIWNALKEASAERFKEASALFSQEDGPDIIQESSWVTSRWYGGDAYGTIRYEGLE